MRAIAFDKERLERGQSTENVGVAIYRTILGVKKRQKEREEAENINRMERIKALKA